MPLPSRPLGWLHSRDKLLIYSSLTAAILAFLYRRSRANTGTSSSKTALYKETPPETFEKHKQLFPVVEDLEKNVGVNHEFLHQLRAIAKILFPHWYTKEAFLLVLHSAFLILRTYLSVVVARIDGRIVRDLVKDNMDKSYEWMILMQKGGPGQRQGEAVFDGSCVLVCDCYSCHIYK